MEAGRRLLIVNADDFGYCAGRNEGIIRCIRENGVSSVSVLVNGMAVEEARLLRSFPLHSLSVGLHFNISEGCPLSPVSSIPSLLDKENHFLGKFSFHQASIKGEIINEEVERELTAQVNHFKLLMDRPPTHVDGHQHVHVFPGVRDAFAKVLRNENITWTRMPIDNQLEKCDWINAERKKFYNDVVIMAKESSKIFKTNNINFTERFIGMCCMGKDMTLQRLKSAILDYKRGEECHSCEIMVHPGYAALPGIGGCGTGPDDFALSPEREHEMNILCSQNWKDLIKDINAELVCFTQILPIKDNL
ncbi:carbohydrate deacetylase-like [Centruroides vittatus]|uniref:carbohydrate deacetylase-like n=1 Tax=Centruroides vittatus TaxID=120091 RepID=UPI0035108B45